MRLIDADALTTQARSEMDADLRTDIQTLLAKEICERLCKWIDEQPAIEPQRWIPCSERLPVAEYGESPNVYCYCHDVERGGRWAEMLYFNGGVWCKPTGETFDYKVLAWYPLPKKPYGGE